jgi:uncharacterized protein YbjQ (UPF0145 family)
VPVPRRWETDGVQERDPSTLALMNELPITTANELPGQRISENLGVAFGLVVRSVGLAKGFTAGIKALRQGEVSEYTELLEDSRRHALDRLVQNAQLLGANGIVAMRFDTSEVGQSLTEIVAYGTAVKVEPVA